MGVEEIPTATEEQTNPENPPNDDDTEEGEIVGEEDSSIKKSAEIPLQQHPLEHSWTFWFDNLSAKSKQAAWGSSMRSIYTFATVEEFWSVFNNIRQPSQLAVGTDLYCFKYKIEPKWEDPVCSNGGNWTATFPTKGRSDKYWLYTLLAMIGEQFDHGDEICGAVVNVRGRQERISLWTKNASNEAAQLSIGKQWKKFIDHNDNIGFIFHEDAKLFDKNAKSKYTI
ncbi:hypothetical protein HS088_TW14G00428 [Tripterygium wilfordii]|uniref:Eukaryotic translation initiation factor 4E-1 n=1 Tax=Tripterygium wilfordii TaxID=458696 RepID=A0A7J7CQP9_TRIWF|nr:eukaryotic translation initiation factor 4E-1-like [Tripterygium wilfordii]KAF5736289.1 hypothetical protein HS088_TW14G00428 [Tripterygium wilfordii]